MRLLWLIVFIALGLVAYLGYRVVGDHASLRSHEVQRLLDERLVDANSRVKQAMGRLERELLARLAEAPSEIEALRALGDEEPLARQVFRVDAAGRLVFPIEREDASEAERAFLRRTESIWHGRAVLYRTGAATAAAEGTEPSAAADPGSSSAPQSKKPGADDAGRSGDSLVDLAARQPHGWLSWYWAEGLHLLFWRRAPDGGVIGVEVERVGLLARVTASLPTTELAEGRMMLANSRGGIVHQWGPYEPGETPGAVVDPAASMVLAHPLDAWRLDYLISPAQRAAFSGGSQLGLLLGLGAVCIALLGVAVYVHREYGRTMRDASQRVTFVTQVSHELKTPLTNIRIYAELLADSLDDPIEEGSDGHEGSEGDDPSSGDYRRAQIIVSESERLTRLINNILTFGRQQKGALEIERRWIEIDAVVSGVLEQFGPALLARGIEVTAALGAPASVRADADAVEQIVSNLLSNVDKYAASGGVVEVSTFERGACSVVRVADRGPGIPPAQRKAIFRPFYRLSDRLADGVTGTGIGLSIARELARLNGGELTLVESDAPGASADGACFELSLISRQGGEGEGADASADS